MKTLNLTVLAIAIAVTASANAQYYPGGAGGYPGGQNPYAAAQAQYLTNPQSGIGGVQLASCNSGGCYGDPMGSCGPGGCGLLGGGGGFGGGGAGGFGGGGFGGGQHGPNGSGGCCLPRWFDVSAEWLFWDRDFGDSLNLSSDGRLGPTALSTDDLEIKNESGYRLTGAYLVAPATAIEATYFGGFNWSSAAVANSATNELFSVFSDFGSDPFAGFPQTDFGSGHRLGFSSELDNGEVNLRHRWVSANCIVHSSTLVGARYLRLHEDLTYNTVTPNGNMNYALQVDNDLVGAQVGGDFMICISPRFKIGGDAKAGVYGTHSKQRTDAIFTGGSLAELESASDVAFVGESGLNALFQVTPRLMLKAGYQVLYVTGVATAVDNFNTESPFATRSAFIHNNGDVFYHGANLGFEYTW